ncbi:MAG: phage tail protein [Armatimonadetes bacterium]|nr:phage tail protein [Armatimonadota bacterium]
MPKGFVKNAHRIDPYKTLKFRVLWDGRPVLGASEVRGLKRTTAVGPRRSGGDNSSDHKSPGRTTSDALTIERGITHDEEFQKWANRVHSHAGDAAMDLVRYKEELTLEVMNEKGQVALRYFLHGCWVSEFTAVPALDANANAVAIETIKVELEGFERDRGAKEPDETSAPPTR